MVKLFTRFDVIPWSILHDKWANHHKNLLLTEHVNLFQSTWATADDSWYLPWPASCPTSSLTTSYYLIYCGLVDDSVLATHTHTRAQIRTCSQMLPVHLTAGVFFSFFFFKWSVGLLWVFFLHLEEQKQRHMLWVTAVCHDDQSGRMASCVGGDVFPQTAYCQGSGQKYKSIYLTDRLQSGDSWSKWQAALGY